MTDSEKVNLSL